MSTVLVFLTMDSDETHKVMEFQCGPMRSVTLPYGAQWVPDMPGYWTREATDANIIAEIAKACPPMAAAGIPLPQCVSFKVITQEDIPKSREFRDAWEHDGTTIVHNMEKARQIHMVHLRQARVDALGALDMAWMQAIGQKDSTVADAIEAQRQALRDLPNTVPVETAQTVKELTVMWPEGLPR
jgi:hypothetical protein